MTVVLRRRASVFHAEGGWFSANWHFSFDQYWDEANMGLGDLGVSNGARLVPGAAWPMHPHRDIEGIAYVAEGTFEHADSRGNGGVLRPGSVQRATLGSGMQHSERNGSTTEPMRFIQMWIMPSRRGLEPSIEQREFSAESRRKDRKSTRLNSSHGYISYAVFCLKKKLPAGNSVYARRRPRRAGRRRYDHADLAHGVAVDVLQLHHGLRRQLRAAARRVRLVRPPA